MGVLLVLIFVVVLILVAKTEEPVEKYHVEYEKVADRHIFNFFSVEEPDEPPVVLNLGREDFEQFIGTIAAAKDSPDFVKNINGLIVEKEGDNISIRCDNDHRG